MVLTDTMGVWFLLVVELKLDFSYLISGKENHPFYKHYSSVQRSHLYFIMLTIIFSTKLALLRHSEITRASSDKDHEDFTKKCQRSYHSSTSFV